MFEDISKFDAENPIVGRLLREIDINEKQSDSDFIKSLPSHPGKEFEIQKRLDRLRENNSNNFKRNNNSNTKNNFGSSRSSLFDGGAPPSLPKIEDFLNGESRSPQPPLSQPLIGSSLFETQSNNPFVAITFNLDDPIVKSSTNYTQPPIGSSLFETQSNKLFAAPTFNLDDPIVRPSTSYKPPKGIENNLFGSQAAEALIESKTKTQDDIDDFLCELPDNMLELVPGDGLLTSLGTQAEDLFNDNAPPTKEEEEEEILKNIMDEYEIEKIRDTMDEEGKVPESIYFFMVVTATNLITPWNF